MPEQTFFGKYLVQDEIARGGMGVVYKAIDQTLNRIVAIKVLFAHFSSDPSFTERFLREARAMARLDHENIVRIHAVEENHGSYYLVMEYVAGTNLRAIIRDSRKLTVRDAVTTALQIANALAYAHAHDIIHRDIKPANILVNARFRAKITDFGIAAALDEASITLTGQIIGTAEYMSPEQARGGMVDHRSDLYSLGIVLYEMAVGRTPFHGVPKTAILGKLLDDRNDIPLEFPPSIPSSVKAVIEDLVRREPEYRTPDADILASQLKDCLATLPQTIAADEGEPTIIASPESGHLGTSIQRTPRSVPPSTPTIAPQTPRTRPPLTPPVTPTIPPKSSSTHADLDETDILPTPKPSTPAQAQRSLGTLLRSNKVVPFAAIALAVLLVLAGITFFLTTSSQEIRPPTLAQSQVENSDREKPRAAEKTRLEDEKRRLADDEARLASKAREAEALRAEQEAEQKRQQAEQERISKEKGLAAQRVRAEAEQRRNAEEQARLARERKTAEQRRAKEEADQKRLQAEKDRIDKEIALKQTQLQAKQLSKADDEVPKLLARQAAELKRLQTEKDTIEKEKELAALRAQAEEEQRRKAQEETKQERERHEVELKRLQTEKDLLLKERDQASQRARAEEEQRRKAEADARLEREQQEAEQKRLNAAREAAEKEKQAVAQRARAEEEKRQVEEEAARRQKEQQVASLPSGSQGAAATTRELREVLEQFKRAYEQEDMATLQKLTEMGSERARNLRVLFENYRTIKVSIVNVSVTDKGATALVIHDVLIDKNGDMVMPSPMLRSTRIQVRKEGGQWTKIVW
jgi:serine/threonine-protein kinase